MSDEDKPVKIEIGFEGVEDKMEKFRQKKLNQLEERKKKMHERKLSQKREKETEIEEEVKFPQVTP